MGSRLLPYTCSPPNHRDAPCCLPWPQSRARAERAWIKPWRCAGVWHGRNSQWIRDQSATCGSRLALQTHKPFLGAFQRSEPSLQTKGSSQGPEVGIAIRKLMSGAVGRSRGGDKSTRNPAGRMGVWGTETREGGSRGSGESRQPHGGTMMRVRRAAVSGQGDSGRPWQTGSDVPLTVADAPDGERLGGGGWRWAELLGKSSTWDSRLTGCRNKLSSPPPPASLLSGRILTSSASYTQGQSCGWRSQEGCLEEGGCGWLVCLP